MAIYHEKFAVYLIVYFGDKLPKKRSDSGIHPRRYIGSSKVSNINNGYLGSVSSKKYSKIWLEETKSNKSKFKLKILSYHDTDEDARHEEKRIQIKYDVVKSDLYVNLALASPGGYFGRTDTGREFSEETKRKMSDNRKGKTYEEIFGEEKAKELREKRRSQISHNKGKPGKTPSNETRLKLREKIWITNGEIDAKILFSAGIPDGWRRGRTKGVANSENTSFKRKEVVQKIKQTKLERYGDKNYNNYSKMKETSLKKYGVEHHTKTEENSINTSNRNIEKANRKIVIEIKVLLKKFGIKLRQGWYLKSDLELQSTLDGIINNYLVYDQCDL